MARARAPVTARVPTVSSSILHTQTSGESARVTTVHSPRAETGVHSNEVLNVPFGGPMTNPVCSSCPRLWAFDGDNPQQWSVQQPMVPQSVVLDGYWHVPLEQAPGWPYASSVFASVQEAAGGASQLEHAPASMPVAFPSDPASLASEGSSPPQPRLAPRRSQGKIAARLVRQQVIGPLESLGGGWVAGQPGGGQSGTHYLVVCSWRKWTTSGSKALRKRNRDRSP